MAESSRLMGRSRGPVQRRTTRPARPSTTKLTCVWFLLFQRRPRISRQFKAAGLSILIVEMKAAKKKLTKP